MKVEAQANTLEPGGSGCDVIHQGKWELHTVHITAFNRQQHLHNNVLQKEIQYGLSIHVTV